MNAIEFNNVNKNLYNLQLKNINIRMKKGEILGVVGESGAGKTTLLKLILNFYKPKSGEISMFNLNSIRDNKEIKSIIGVIPQSIWFDNNCRPMSFLKNTLKYRKIKNREEIDFLVEYFEMKLSNKIGNLTLLDKKKLAVINGLITNSKLIIVDAPETINDPKTRVKLYDILEEKNRAGISVLIFTSNLKEAQSICDNIYYLHQGEIIEEEDQSHKLSNDKILKYYDKNINKDMFTGIGAKLVRSGNETVFYYNKSLDILSEAIFRSGLIDYTVEDSTLEEKLTIIEKGNLINSSNFKTNDGVDNCIKAKSEDTIVTSNVKYEENTVVINSKKRNNTIKEDFHVTNN